MYYLSSNTSGAIYRLVPTLVFCWLFPAPAATVDWMGSVASRLVTAIPKSATQHAPVRAHFTSTFLLLISRWAIPGLPCLEENINEKCHPHPYKIFLWRYFTVIDLLLVGFRSVAIFCCNFYCKPLFESGAGVGYGIVNITRI